MQTFSNKHTSLQNKMAKYIDENYMLYEVTVGNENMNKDGGYDSHIIKVAVPTDKGNTIVAVLRLMNALDSTVIGQNRIECIKELSHLAGVYIVEK